MAFYFSFWLFLFLWQLSVQFCSCGWHLNCFSFVFHQIPCRINRPLQTLDGTQNQGVNFWHFFYTAAEKSKVSQNLNLFLSSVLIFMICFWWSFSVISYIWHISFFFWDLKNKISRQILLPLHFHFLQSFVWEYRAIQVQIRALPI